MYPNERQSIIERNLRDELEETQRVNRALLEDFHNLAGRYSQLEAVLKAGIFWALSDGPCWCHLGGAILLSKAQGKPLPDGQHNKFCLMARAIIGTNGDDNEEANR